MLDYFGRIQKIIEQRSTHPKEEKKSVITHLIDLDLSVFESERYVELHLAFQEAMVSREWIANS
jgi:hypothetical protein